MKLLSLLVLSIATQALFAQHFNVSMSEKLDYNGSLVFVKSGDHFYKMDIDWNMQMAYTAKLYKARHSIKLSKYDKNMKLVAEKKLADGKKDFGPLYSELREFNGKLCLIYFQLADENGSLDIFLSEIDQTTLATIDAKLILQIDQKNFGFFKAAFGNFKYNLFIKNSQDKSKLLVFWCSDQINKIFFGVVDSKITFLRKVTDDIVGVKSLAPEDVQIDNAGNVFFAYNQSNLYANKASGGNKKFVLKAGASPVTQLFISSASNSEVLYIAGIFADGTNKQKGVFSQTLITSDLALSPVVKTDYPADLGTKLWVQLENYYGKPKKFYMDPLEHRSVIGEDGSIDLFARSLKENNYPSGPNGVYNTIERVWGSYVYIQFKQDKAIFTRIPKVPAKFDDCLPFKSNNKSYVFYRDDENNKNSDIMDQEENTKRKIINMGASIDENGNLSREPIILPIVVVMLSDHAIRQSSSSFLIPGGSSITFSPASKKVELQKKSDFYWVTLKVL